MDASIREQLRRSLVEIAPAFAAEVPLEKQRQVLDQMGAAAQRPAGLEVRRAPLAGLTTEWLTTPESSERQVILYLHGGGYVMGSCDSHRALAGNIGHACGVQVVLPEYRLAPEHPFPAAVDDALAAYGGLLAQGHSPADIVVCGDSAGGGLTLALLVALRDASIPLPRAAVVLSPFTDLACTGESFVTRAALDPWLAPALFDQHIRRYAGEHDRRDPRLSPLYADLRGLPPVLVQVGDHEVLLSDSMRFVERARSAGVDATLEVWPEVWHVFQLFAPALPEANDALAKIGAFVRAQLAAR